MKPNAYTVGNKQNYDESFTRALGTAEWPLTKVGRRDDYEGGWVWPTYEAALSFLKTTDMHYDFGSGPVRCEVYGLVLPNSWEQDVSPQPGSDGVHRLLKDSPLVQL